LESSSEQTRIVQPPESVPAAADGSAISALNTALEKAEQRINSLEESVRTIRDAHSEPSEPDSQDLQELKTILLGMEKRIEQLEARLDKMESGAKEELDRAAAAAAARILREELAAILAEEAE
jgi:predicted  nucleic acid-binding Zn-ribbon protein